MVLAAAYFTLLRQSLRWFWSLVRTKAVRATPSGPPALTISRPQKLLHSARQLASSAAGWSIWNGAQGKSRA